MLETIFKVRNATHEIDLEVCKAVDLNDLDGVIDKTKALINLYREEFYTFTRDECIKAITSILTHLEARGWSRARWNNDKDGNQLAKMLMHIFESILARVDDRGKKASLTNGVKGCICDLSEYLAEKNLFHEAEILMEEVKSLPMNRTMKKEVSSLVEKYRHLGAGNLGTESSSYVIDISSKTVEFLFNRNWIYWHSYQSEYQFESESESYREKYKKGIGYFLDFAFFKHEGNKIPCPCTKCMNSVLSSREDVEAHLLAHGFVSSYYWLWDKHGESLSVEDPTLSLESAEECEKGNESCHGKSSSLDGFPLTSSPTHVESDHGATVHPGSYDGASDSFTSFSAREIDPPSTTPDTEDSASDTEDSAMLDVIRGIKFSIEVTGFKKTGNIYEGVVLEWHYATKRSFIPFESRVNAEHFFGILRDFSLKHSSILQLFGVCEIREKGSFVVVEPVLPLLEFFERELKKFCKDKGKKRGKLENIDKAEWTEFISPKLQRIFRDVNLGIIFLLGMGNSPCYIEDQIYVTNDGSHGRIVPRSEIKELKRIEDDLGLLRHAILQVINLPWKDSENLIQMVGADSTILSSVYRIPDELFDFLDQLNPINAVAEQRTFDHPFFWTMNERVIFMEKLRYHLKGDMNPDLFFFLEDGKDWRVNFKDAVQAGLLDHYYDSVYKYNEGRYGKEIHYLITFVVACLTHCIDYAGNAAPELEKVEVLRGLMKIFPKLYTVVNGILLDWVVRSYLENLNADKSTDPSLSTSLASPLLLSMKLLSQDMMLARNELVME